MDSDRAVKNSGLRPCKPTKSGFRPGGPDKSGLSLVGPKNYSSILCGRVKARLRPRGPKNRDSDSVEKI